MLLNISVPSYLWVPSLLLPCYLQPQIPAACEAVNKYESGRLKDISWLAFRFQSTCQTPSISLLTQGNFSIVYWPCLSQLAAWDRAVLYPRADACAFSATALHLVQATESTVPKSHSEILQTIILLLFRFWSLRISSQAVPLAACLSMASS